MMPRAAVDHFQKVERLHSQAQKATGDAWRQVDPRHISESWSEALPELSVSITEAQVRAAELGSSYGADTLAAQGLYSAPEGWANPRSFGGQSSRGAPLEAALYSVAPSVKSMIAGGAMTTGAMRSGEKMSRQISKTLVTDASRGASGVDTFARPRIAYVRMVGPTACGRCAVLAGRIYRGNEGFLRHPNCQCIHVSTSTSAAESEGLVADPYQYFESLSEADQERAFTKSGAQAIRDGADMGQVVNSRRGMSYAGVSKDGTRRGQRRSMVTGEGTTRRGYFRSQSDTNKRLTPDAIYQQGLPREQTLSMLRENGYLLPQGQVPEGAIRGSASELARAGAMTAAEQRVQSARLQWEAVQQGRNPFGKGPLTPTDKATAENNYRRWLTSDGQVFTE